MRQRPGLGVSRVSAVLGALAVVFAVLSMHAVDGGAHTAGAASHAVGAGSSEQGPMQAHLDGVVEDVSATTRAAVTALAPPGMPGEGAMAAAVCIAVLLSVVLVVRHGWRRTGFRMPLRVMWTHGIDRVRRAYPGQPPDLLTELCVMRT